MKKEWILPTATVEYFSTNEYLSTCWEIACVTDKANRYERSHRNKKQTHDNAHCGNPTNQFLQDTDGDGFIDRMTEVGTDGLGKLNCTVFQNDDYRRTKKLETIKPGDYVYWTTEAGTGKNKRTWHHQGTASLISSTNPNRS